MLPSFVARRVRVAWLAGAGTALWLNRRDVARWLRFVQRSVAARDEFDLHSWLVEARVRAAVTSDAVLRSDPSLSDVVVEDGTVTVHLAASGRDAIGRLNALRKVKGVADVWCVPNELVTSGEVRF
jgi:hypothetical protein